MEATPLGLGDVHVWHVELDQPSEIVRSLYRLLDDDERRRAADFRFDQDQARFIVTHGLFRSVLAQYIPCEPEALQFSLDAAGKPRLLSIESNRQVQFNISHSANQALFAFAAGRPVGIDIECIRAMPNLVEVAATVFSPREQLILKVLPIQDRIAAFFNGWTRKEALLKGLGTGFSLPAQDIEVSLAPGEPAHVHSIKGNRHTQWRLETITSIPGYVAALAVEGPIGAVSYFRLALGDAVRRENARSPD